MRRIVVAGAAALVAGCGTNDAAGPEPEGNRLPAQQAMALPLGYPQANVLRRFGPPAERLSQAPFRCLVYAADGGPDSWVRMCFKDGRMTGVATIPSRRLAMTLAPRASRVAPGLRRPKTVNGHVRKR